MRLIDLDQIIFVPIVDESNGGIEYEMEMTIWEMFDKFLDGFQPEIVDAVPVEWLEESRRDSMDAQWHYAVATVLQKWRQEQEGERRDEE